MKNVYKPIRISFFLSKFFNFFYQYIRISSWFLAQTMKKRVLVKQTNRATETEGQRDKKTERQRDRETERHIHTEWKINRDEDSETERQRDRFDSSVYFF